MLQAASPRNVAVSPASVALVLAHREQVGQQLARVELVGERVDHRDTRVGRHLLDPLLREGAPHDRRCLAAEDPGDVGAPTRGRRCRPARRRPASGARRARRCRRRRTPGCAGSACRRSWRRCAARPAACASYGARFSVAARSSTSACSAGLRSSSARKWRVTSGLPPSSCGHRRVCPARSPGTRRRRRASGPGAARAGSGPGVGALMMKPRRSPAAATSAARGSARVSPISSPAPRDLGHPRVARGPRAGARRASRRGRAGRRSRWCRGRRGRPRRRPGCRRRSCRGCPARRGVRRRRGRCTAPIGMPPPRPFASVTRSGAAVLPWWANHWPVRPTPVWISSSHSRAPCGGGDLAGGGQVAGRRDDDAGLALDRLEHHRRRLVGHRGPQRLDVAVRDEGDVARQAARTARGRPSSAVSASAPMVRPWNAPSAATRWVRPVRRVSLKAASLASVPELVKNTRPGESRAGRAGARRARSAARW